MKWIFACLLLAGCGYQWNSGLSPDSVPITLSVPYVIGDGDGSLTAELIRAIGQSGLAQVKQSGARYVLRAEIIQSDKQTIGYRRDRQKISGESKKNLIASEARKTISIQASLHETNTGEIVSGPFQIEAESEYDYVDGDSIQDLTFITPKGTPAVVLPFSLGQLESIDAAEEAALRPLHVQMARKILDLIFSDW